METKHLTSACVPGVGSVLDEKKNSVKKYEDDSDDEFEIEGPPMQ